MRKVLIIAVCLLILGSTGIGFLWYNNNDFKNTVSKYLESGSYQTLEARYLPQQIMDSHYQELLGDDDHHYLEPSYYFHPYVMMEVKYLSDKKTREGVILWSLVNGEMVLNTETWEQTHGFEDAINAQATSDEFQVIYAIAKNNGSRAKDELISDLNLDANIVNPWISSALDKHLIAKKGNILQLHLENPKIIVPPQTKFNRMLVSKPSKQGQRASEKYSPWQIEKVAKAAFGSDFSIRHLSEVYLPVYGINVENPDGSITTTYWNAVTGQLIQPKYFRG